MSFWSDFTAAFSKVETAAKTEIQAVIQYFTPMVEAGAEELASVALSAVLQEAPKVISGAEKLSSATATIVSTLAAQGKSIAINIAEAAAQAAVNKISTKPAA